MEQGGWQVDLTRSFISIGLAIYPQYIFLWVAYLTILKVTVSTHTLEVGHLPAPSFCTVMENGFSVPNLPCLELKSLRLKMEVLNGNGKHLGFSCHSRLSLFNVVLQNLCKECFQIWCCFYFSSVNEIEIPIFKHCQGWYAYESIHWKV